ncbi:ABC transporter permease [Paenalkalicoccus suaedae]|uniref:ABC transporter permease n=1 Tax=Paenalkalicoccus suaedae TaxID=2592382 RepID=A0A859FJN5_9BACI|nr:ABC transporter permease [Paenalkalicoccus suaedae]QKS73012.1 ABC transporter permease [Paenalkalicoccus suaedae]
MTITKLAYRNLRRNLKSYGLYIGSTVFAISIYFTFVALRYSDEILSLSEVSSQISGLMNAASFVLLIFVAVFILYSNAFFTKKRKKEIALYSLLGVRKPTIGLMLFVENMVIGLLSLMIGIGFGFLFSQVFILLLLQLMGLDLGALGAVELSLQAVIHTALVFSIIFFVTSVQGYSLIYRVSLLELFHAEKKGEALPKSRIILTLFGFVLLGAGYWIALEDLATSDIWRYFGIATPLLIIGLTVIGTFFVFQYVFITVLHQLKKKRSFAWKGLHSWTMSQLLSRIRANARTLTIIATLSAATMTAGGAVFGTYYNIERDVSNFAPFTFMWEGEAQEIDPSIVEFEARIPAKNVRVEEDTGLEFSYSVLPFSTYEALANRLDAQTLIPPESGTAHLVNPYFNVGLSTVPETVIVEDDTIAIDEVVTEAVYNVETLGGLALVVSDEDYTAYAADEQVYRAVTVSDYQNQLALSQELALEAEQFSSATQDYQDNLEANGALLFVGSFLGLVFLAATGSMIFFKVLTEAEEDAESFAMLDKLGAPHNELIRSIRHQVGMIFVAPLLVAVMHSAVALYAFSTLLGLNLVVPVLIWMLLYSLVYGMYYVMTIKAYKRLVLNQIRRNS